MNRTFYSTRYALTQGVVKHENCTVAPSPFGPRVTKKDTGIELIFHKIGVDLFENEEDAKTRAFLKASLRRKAPTVTTD